ncbi:MAG: nicotinamide-nucleotide adenylyltransferase [Candidatus Micrarchaeia archaeon]
MNCKSGLFIGRFQPVHNGHMEAIKFACSKCEKLIVVVGSSQKSYELDDPFTVGERIEMVSDAIAGAGLLAKCKVLSVPDIQNNALWVAHVESLVPPFDSVFSNNSLVKTLFSDAGYKVFPVPMANRKEYEGTKIRKLMLEGRGISKLIPPQAHAVIERIGATKRMRSIADLGESG